MTDRELLELAAKAAGFNDASWAAEQACIATLEQKQGFKLFWNPLADDGEALRLAVGLKLEVAVWFDKTTVYSDDTQEITEKHGENALTATRRAIVRAAAEIGKGMK